MYDIRIVPHDAVHVKFLADESVTKVASNYFRFRIKNAHFHPKVKAKMWDGYIRLLNYRDGLIYAGLLKEIIEFANSYDYTISIDSALKPDTDATVPILKEWIKTLNLPEHFEQRDYQIEALAHIINNRKGLIISPTGSGKSLIAYYIAKWYNKKTLIVVPTLNLITQMRNDFIDYGYDKDKIHLIYQGQTKYSDCPVTISTWQSIYKMKPEFFAQFDCVIADEVHGFTSKEMVAMMERMPSTFNRIGMTGSLDGCDTNEMVLTGLFGAKFVTTTTKELIDEGVLTKPIIKILTMTYPKKGRPKSDSGYDAEIDFICKNTQRNQFITNIVRELKGNTLVLFNYVEKHGKILYNLGKENLPDPDKVHLIYGKVDKEDRELIRIILSDTTDNVLYASYKTLSTGVNIKNLHNIIFASPSRSTIRIVQSIGRGLRRHHSKDIVKIYDLADVLKHSKSQMLDRLAIYETQEFEYKLIKVDFQS